VFADTREAAYCGDYCGKCPHYDVDCPGCLPCVQFGCHFIRCCLQKGYDHCGMCPDLPCDKLLAFVPDDREGCYHGYHIDNLRLRREIGTEAWLERQKAVWGHLK